MLKKLGGFEIGQGIGKSNQGMANPIQVSSNPGQSGVGIGLRKKTEKQTDLLDEHKNKSKHLDFQKEDQNFMKVLAKRKEENILVK